MKTPLYDFHVALQGKIVNFGGWALPVYYTSILNEHRWTRESCGVFDVSHLGEIHVQGSGAFDFLQRRLTNDLNKLVDRKILYSLLCDEKGFTLDDILIYQEARDDYYLIVNASTIESDFEALARTVSGGVQLTNHSDQTACIAVQGPRSEGILETLFGFELKTLRYYFFKQETFQDKPVWVSRSGYTGEDGFEIFCPSAQSPAIWERLVKDGRHLGILPCGLGSRNTLRLEAGNILYGADLDTATTPIEAGLSWAVSFSKGPFVGRDALLKQKESGPQKKLVGFKVLDKPIAREHYPLLKEGRRVGIVTSGSFGPTAGCNIGLGYVEKGLAAYGTEIQIEIHGRHVKAEIVKLPFVATNHKKIMKG